MENNKLNNSAMSSKLWLIIGILALVAIVVVLATAFEKKEVVESPSSSIVDQVTNEVNVSENGNPLEGSTIVVPGANPVIDGQVVNIQGEPVRNDVRPMDINAPRQTGPVSSTDLAPEVVKLEVSASGWSPSEFTVAPGSLVTLSVTSADTANHTFRFRETSLTAVRVGVYSGETRAISFNAPANPGEYEFYCDVPGHARRGEIGKMIVQ